MVVYDEEANIEATAFLKKRKSIMQILKEGINFEHGMIMNEVSKCKASTGGSADVTVHRSCCESDEPSQT